jgi:hypothetical protein
MVSGSLASVFYGEPRLTMDVDVVVHLGESEAAIIPEIFAANDYYVPPSDVMSVEIARPTRGHFNVIHFGTGMKAVFTRRENIAIGVGRLSIDGWSDWGKTRSISRLRNTWFSGNSSFSGKEEATNICATFGA